MTFQERVEAVVARIPPGRVMTYGDVAAAIGAPRSARQVGWAMARCHPALPWHRVVNARGELSAIGDDPAHRVAQRAALEAEGVVFVSGRLDLGRVRA